MSITTIYKCDKCGAEQNDANQFWTVGVTANHNTYHSNSFVTQKSMQMCRKCIDELGIFVQEKPDTSDE